MNKKFILSLAFLAVSIFVSAQVKSYKYPSDSFNEATINEILDASKKSGTQDWELEKLKQHLYQRLEHQNKFGANQKNMVTPPQVMAACNNIDFENGTTIGWTLSSGNINGVTLPCNTCASGAGAIATITSATTSGTTWTNGIDNCSGQPVVAPNGGQHSLCLNNNTAGGKLQEAQQTFAVGASNSIFTYQYLAVLEDGGHVASDQPYFFSQILDGSNNPISCTYYLQSASGSAGWTSCCTDAYYKGWVTVTIDLTAYIGQNVTVQFIVSDCNQGGHYGYCYIDASCNSTVSGQITASNPLCTGGSTILSGPSGYSTYNWTGPVSGNTQNLTTGTQGNYTLTVLSSQGCPSPTLYYNLAQTSTVAPTVSIQDLNDPICIGSTTTLTASGADTYTWSTGGTSNSVAVSPSGNTIYTVTGTDASTGCVNYATQTVHVIATNIQASNNPICSGATTTLTATGASTYTWSSNAGSATTNTVAVSPTGNTTYTVVSTDAISGCVNTATLIVTTAGSLTIHNSNDSICKGGNSTITASGANTYTWSTGATTANITVTPTVTTTYTVTATGSCTNASTITSTVKVLPLPNITVTTSPVCEGSVANLMASGANTYTWNTSATTATLSVTPSVTTTYTVTGTDVNLCKNTAVATVIVPVNVAPTICVATTDSTTGFAYNYIIWDKTSYTNVDSFIVYRYDVVSTNYLRIGAVSKTNLSEFKDTSFSVGGPNGGNPLYSSWKYKLAIKDTCGQISALSPYHQTMFVQQNGANFSWNAYSIESGQSNPVTGYSFLRDDNNTGNWHVLVNTAGTSATDPNYSSFPNANWRVDALGFNCTPTFFRAGNNSVNSLTNNKSHSNPIKNTLTGINQFQVNTNQISIYPNPANEILYIDCKLKNATLFITDIIGNKIKQTNVENELTTLDISNLSKGVYFLNVKTTNNVITKKFIIQR